MVQEAVHASDDSAAIGVTRAHILSLIPARGGSKGIPRKNLAMLAGKPLIAHTIEQAKAVRSLRRVLVSTEDEEIAEVSREYGAAVQERPEHLALDETPTEAVISYVLDTLPQEDKPDIVVLLQPTSPIRFSADIENAITLLEHGGYDSLLSVVASHHFLWKEVGGRAFAYNYNPLSRPRRQEMRQYAENGSIYMFRTAGFMESNCRLFGNIGLYVMDYWTQFEVDTPESLGLCAMIMNSRSVNASS